MTASLPDPRRIPVVVGSGQAIEREDLVTPVDLMERAAAAALEVAPRLRGSVELVSVVNMLSRGGPAPASELAGRLGIEGARCEVTTVGGNSPQWLVNRAAAAISRGELAVTLVAGAEAIRSSRARRAEGLPPAPPPDAAPDPVVGDDWPPVGPAESAIGLLAPVQIYPMFESVVAARAGRDAGSSTPCHRRALRALHRGGGGQSLRLVPPAARRRATSPRRHRTTGSSASPTPSG